MFLLKWNLLIFFFLQFLRNCKKLKRIKSSCKCLSLSFFLIFYQLPKYLSFKTISFSFVGSEKYCILNVSFLGHLSHSATCLTERALTIACQNSIYLQQKCWRALALLKTPLLLLFDFIRHHALTFEHFSFFCETSKIGFTKFSV